MSLRYRVVEKKFNQGRTNLVPEGGVWHPKLEMRERLPSASLRPPWLTASSS